MFYVYVLRLNDGEFYVGRTSDLKRRIVEHKNGKVHSTKNRRPICLIYYEAYIERQDSVDRELFLKTGDGRRSLRKQIRSYLITRS
ncbi:MAG: GIY-YIG nuclease family protein [bacterium]|nr:GIY-YIG nuclease family protein [bacterium]